MRFLESADFNRRGFIAGLSTQPMSGWSRQVSCKHHTLKKLHNLTDNNMLCLMYITCTKCTYYKHMYVHQRFAVIGIETFDLSVLTSPISFFQKDLMSNAWYNVTLLKKLSFTTHYTKVITR